MAHFFGIAPGEERSAQGIRVAISADGERAWMHGKWLDLGDDHAVAWIAAGQKIEFWRPDGCMLSLGAFPSWVVRGTSKRACAIAVMFNFGQFRGGSVVISSRGERHQFDIPAPGKSERAA